jgi:hypothetical protein
MAYIKKTDDNATKKTVQEKKVEKTPVVKEQPKKIKQYSGDDLIPCKSMTRGELIYIGNKTGEIYKWSDFGDITEVEYQDLLGLRAKKSDFIFKTMFFILDEELLEDPKWAEVKAIYDKIYFDDIQELIDMPLAKFKSVFPTLPEGLKKAMVVEVGTQMENGTFDSIQKIKFIDEICKTDLSSML